MKHQILSHQKKKSGKEKQWLAKNCSTDGNVHNEALFIREVLKKNRIKIAILWDATPCSRKCNYLSFGEAWYLKLHSKSVIFLPNLKQSAVVTNNSITRKWRSLLNPKQKMRNASERLSF